MALAVATVIRRLPVPVLARATGAHPRTVERWRAGVTPRRLEYRGRLDDLASILALLGPGLSTQAQRQWFTASSAYLGGGRPIDELAAGRVELARGAAAAYAGGDPT
ncbi:MAG: hypothetical protein E6J50_04330 [Chloroflexi bacterium]|nr:MAG: hypothetical protein E6J50_04330 [Chloroflexota bacterium]